jgi:hypothetical protein
MLGPKALKGSPVHIHLYVDDADTFTAQALAAGATVTMPVADMFWGDRYVGRHARSGCDVGTNERSHPHDEPRIRGRSTTSDLKPSRRPAGPEDKVM